MSIRIGSRRRGGLGPGQAVRVGRVDSAREARAYIVSR